MRPRPFLLLIAGFALLLMAAGEADADQEQEVSLYLWSESGEGKLHTWTTGDHGSDGTTVSIPSGSNLFFALHQPLRTDLPVDSYNAPERGFFIELYVNTAVFQSSHLNIKVRDGTSPTGGAVLASGEMDVSSGTGNPDSDDQENEVLYWEDSLGPSYTFDSGHYIIVELENDGDSDVNLGLDTGTDGDTPSRLVMKTNPVRDITVLTEAFNLETSDDDDRQATDRFEPNLPAELARVFFSGTALNAFGAYDVKSVRVQVDDPDDEELFDNELAPTDRGDGSGTVEFDDITWNYNDPEQPGAQQTGSGAYTVRVSAVDQQGHAYQVELAIGMDQYGVYLSTAERHQTVAVGGTATYQLTVYNSGAESDSVVISPSETPSDWTVSPETWESSSLNPGGSDTATFTVEVANDVEMVGDSVVISFSAESQNAPSSQPKVFALTTTTTVGVEYGVALYFDQNGQYVTTTEVEAVTGNWNDFELRVANLGQATDSIDLSATGMLPDWDVEFEYDGERNSGITINGLPREEDGNHVANVTVWVRPAEGGDEDTSSIQLKGTSQGNMTKTAAATLQVSRIFGLSLSVAGGGSTIYANLQPGGTQEVHLLLQSAIEGNHDVQLYVEDLPSGWSALYKDDGETVTQVTISGDESLPLDLLVTTSSSATYQEEGYPVEVFAQDVDNPSVYRGLVLTFYVALNAPPYGTIDSIAPSPAEKGTAVSFNGTGSDSDGTVVGYQWESSIDGELSTNEDFSSSDLSLGHHTITFRVQDNDGAWSSPASDGNGSWQGISLWIYAVPVAIAGADVSTTPTVPVQFNGQGTDEDGTIAKYEWDFDGNGVYDWSSTENGRELNIYNNKGTYTAMLRVTDNDGFTDTDTVVITVTEKIVVFDDEGNVIVTDAGEDEEGIPAPSLAAAVAAVAVIALRRRR